ncbi:MAG TPA: HepT-like ribonuclease domain-containing protein, partial [bacterium]
MALKKEIELKLIKHLEFLSTELQDYQLFATLTWEEYNTDRNKRRNIERWIENIVNSSIDVAKLILTAETLKLPDTYREIVTSLSLVAGFPKELMERLSKRVRLRNIITHEYMDLKWASIK